MKEKQPTSAQHMLELLQDCWKSILGDFLMKLAERMHFVSYTIPNTCYYIVMSSV